VIPFASQRRAPGVTLAVLVLLASTLPLGCGKKEVQKKEDELHIEAQVALSQGNMAGAIDKLTQAIEVKPTHYAYFLRGWIYAQQQGKDSEAKADCEAGLKLEPNNSDLQWLARQLKKPLAQRFKGADKDPPSSKK
jgi:Tfp pilus assembly protein PilF